MRYSVLFSACWLVLAGCGGGGGQGASNPAPAPAPTPAPSPTLDHSGLTPIDQKQPESGEEMAGGAATVTTINEDVFGQRPPPVAADFRLDGNFTSGDHLFRTPHNNVGPLLNTSNCQGCHLRDGRGQIPASVEEPFTSMLVKIGLADGSPDPVYGDQIQTFAEQSFSTNDFTSGWPKYDGSLNGDKLYGEAYTFIEYQEVGGQYPDGTNYSLRQPTYKIKDLSFGPFHSNIRFSPRVAPQAFGVGLLDAIPAEHILALTDPDDSNNDGISGRAASVTNVVTGQQQLGRFSYKAQNPTVLQQVAGAYRGDIGITNKLFPQENCTPAQQACLQVAQTESKTGEQTDFSDLQLALVEFYNRALGVPVRRGFDAQNNSWQSEIVSGRQRFFEVGCQNCHTPRQVTGVAKGSVLGEITLTGLQGDAEPIAMLSEQTIYPYTDLLLHDMGGSCQITQETAEQQSCSQGPECWYVKRCEGLADGLPQGVASGSEWRTAPLWGIGLAKMVNPKASFLHDGRARTIEEAILWHGGEADTVKQRFMQLTKTDRDALLAFVESL